MLKKFVVWVDTDRILDHKMFVQGRSQYTPRGASLLSKKVVAYSMDGHIIKIYNSIKEASVEEKLDYNGLSRICCGKCLYSTKNKRIFLFEKDSIDERLNLIKLQDKHGQKQF